jgi:hypothetical protein
MCDLASHVAKESRRSWRARHPDVANAIVSLSNLWMMKAVVSGAATAWVVDAYTGHAVLVAAWRGEQKPRR